MPETFVPLVATTSAPRESAFASLNAKAAPAAKSAAGPANAGACAKPTITLQRTGEIVSGIRVQCGCGEVIELNCVY
jgi:hypothetical protein